MLALLASAFIAIAPPAAGCVAESGDASTVLRRAATQVGLSALDNHALHVHGFDVESQDYQSDRSYPPYLSAVERLDYWYSPASHVQQRAAGLSMANNDVSLPTTLGTETASYVLRDTALVPSEATHSAMFPFRPLDAIAVLGDWMASGGVRVAQRCSYRDYPRLVLERRGPRGDERLFIDEKSGFPVKLDRTEPHYLWGQTHVEYIYSSWIRVGALTIPGVSFRVVDGSKNIERNVSSAAIVPLDSAPRLVVPARSSPMRYPVAQFLAGTKPDTVRIGPAAFLLRNPGYAEMVALARDTVFMFDATQSEERARNDSAWIAQLFPGRHPVALVVTDLAWPHIGGVRYWVSRGATIYAHRAARPMLESVVARRWTLAPDALERARDRVRLRFVPVSDTLRLAGGDITLFAIDGIASEVALAAFDQPDHFLWASDYIQDASAPTLYLDEVCRALKRVDRVPTRVAAEHLPVSQWASLSPLARCS
jgi:hypothetical protein